MKKVGIALIIVICAFLIYWIISLFITPGHMGILESQMMNMAVHPPEGALPVDAETVKKGPFDSSITYTGSVLAYNDVPIYSRIEGEILSLNVYPGDSVKKGQLLVKLDSREVSSKLNEAQYLKQASLNNYKASVNSQYQAREMVNKSKQAVNSAKATLDYWENEIKRSEALVKDDVISTEEFQKDKAEYENKKAEYIQALSEYRGTQKAFKSAGYQALSQQELTNQASASVKTQSIVKSYTEIKSTIDGIVAERTLPPGTLVSSGMPILKISQVKPVRVQAYVAQNDLAKIKVGDSVLIYKIDNNSAMPFKAKITSVFPSLDLKTRTGTIEATIPNLKLDFLPGESVKMEIVTAKKINAIAVPSSAIVESLDKEAVWVIENGKASLKYVTTGVKNNDRIEIVNGLQEGEIVIIKGNKDLYDGISVVSGTLSQGGMVLKSNRMSEKNNYKLSYAADHYTIEIESLNKPPKMGENPFLIKVSSMHGPVPGNLKVDIKAIMLAMPEMMVPKPIFTKSGKDTFKGNVTLTMPGLWELTITLKEGNNVISTFKINVEIP